MPNRRQMELTIVVVLLLSPVVSMAKIWCAKHLVTSDNQTTGIAAEVGATVL